MVTVRKLLSIYIVICLYMAPSSSYAANRVALIIGNSAYVSANELKNPANDARAIAKKLSSLGFDVIERLDQSKSDMEKTIKDFAHRLKTADAALFYYAGHGIQLHGKNYLIPIDATISDETDVDLGTVSLNLIIRLMERHTKTRIVFLDACRDNPLAKNLARSMGVRGGSMSRGLAQVSSGVGTLVAYATQPGNVALDGDGKNSPFTSALVKHIDTPEVDITQVMQRVRRDVVQQTKGRQVPWDHSSLTTKFVFNITVKLPSASAGPTTDQELVLWQEVKKADSPGPYKAFLKSFPNGTFSALARNKLRKFRELEPGWTEWLSSHGYQNAFNKRVKQRRFPKRIEAKQSGEHVLYRGYFVDYWPNPFDFYTHHSLSDQHLAQKDAFYKSRGFKRIWHQRLVAGNLSYNQVTWVRVAAADHP